MAEIIAERTTDLTMNLTAEADRIAAFIRHGISRTLKKKGAIVAVSGGIDSSTTAALCVRALGRDRVFALLLPERDSNDDSVRYGRMLVDHLGIASELINISPMLEAMGCYRYRDEAIRQIFPEYTSEWRNKIVLNTGSEGGAQLDFFSVVVQDPNGVQKRARLPLRSYLEIVAATNMKQRTRKSLEYFHADRLNYAVAGTPNFLEYDQGFFVKLGDGAADLKPIAHLYKTQVYAMARHLGLPEELCERQPTTDTYSLEQTQEEFYFQLPYQQMDLICIGMETGMEPAVIAEKTGLSVNHVHRFMKEIEHKRKVTSPLHLAPLTLLPPRTERLHAESLPPNAGRGRTDASTSDREKDHSKE